MSSICLCQWTIPVCLLSLFCTEPYFCPKGTLMMSTAVKAWDWLRTDDLCSHGHKSGLHKQSVGAQRYHWENKWLKHPSKWVFFDLLYKRNDEKPWIIEVWRKKVNVSFEALKVLPIWIQKSTDHFIHTVVCFLSFSILFCHFSTINKMILSHLAHCKVLLHSLWFPSLKTQ